MRPSPVRGSVQPPIMRAVPIVSGDGAEVRIDAELPDTQAARDLATLMRSDPPVYSGLSVEFHARREHRDGGRRVVDDAELRGAGADRHAGLSRHARGGPRRRAGPAAAALHLAMAVTAASLAAALGITVADAQAKDDPGILEAGRLLSIAGALVAAYLHDSPDDTDCPADIRDEAVIRSAGYMQNRRTGGHVDGIMKVSGIAFLQTPAAASAVRQSGAAALLAPFVRRTA